MRSEITHATTYKLIVWRERVAFRTRVEPAGNLSTTLWFPIISDLGVQNETPKSPAVLYLPEPAACALSVFSPPIAIRGVVAPLS
jgi:hypothetical protein